MYKILQRVYIIKRVIFIAKQNAIQNIFMNNRTG